MHKSDLTEIKNLKAPPQIVIDVMSAVVALHLNATVTGGWKECLPAINSMGFLESLAGMPRRMQNGQDFSKGLR